MEGQDSIDPTLSRETDPLGVRWVRSEQSVNRRQRDTSQSDSVIESRTQVHTE